MCCLWRFSVALKKQWCPPFTKESAGPKLTHTLVGICYTHLCFGRNALERQPAPHQALLPAPLDLCTPQLLPEHIQLHQRGAAVALLELHSLLLPAQGGKAKVETCKSMPSTSALLLPTSLLLRCLFYALVQEWGILPGSFAKVSLVSVCVASTYQNLGMKAACQEYLPVQMH